MDELSKEAKDIALELANQQRAREERLNEIPLPKHAKQTQPKQDSVPNRKIRRKMESDSRRKNRGK